MITLNILISQISAYVAKHLQLKSWYFGNPWDQLSGGQSILYPLQFGILQPNKISGTSETTVIRFYICDKVKKGRSNELEVLSDTKLMCLDFISYMKNYETSLHINDSIYINISTDITLNDFTESFDDEVAGWWFDMELNSIFEYNLCSVPYDRSIGLPALLKEDGFYILKEDGFKILLS